MKAIAVTVGLFVLYLVGLIWIGFYLESRNSSITPCTCDARVVDTADGAPRSMVVTNYVYLARRPLPANVSIERSTNGTYRWVEVTGGASYR